MRSRGPPQPDGLMAAFWDYERALLANDLDALDAAFEPGDSMRAEGVDLLVGREHITEYRRGRTPPPPRRFDPAQPARRRGPVRRGQRRSPTPSALPRRITAWRRRLQRAAVLWIHPFSRRARCSARDLNKRSGRAGARNGAKSTPTITRPPPQEPTTLRVSGRLRDDPDVGLRLGPVAEDLLSLLVGDRARDHDVLALPPVHRRRNLVLGGELKGVDHPQDLVEITTGRHRVEHDHLDLLVRADHKNAAHGLVVGCRAVGRVAADIGAKHPVGLGDGEVGITDHRVVRGGALRLLDVSGPGGMLVDRVDRQRHDLHTAAVKLRLDRGHVAEFGRADRGEVLRVLSLIHISEPTRLGMISYAVFC